MSAHALNGTLTDFKERHKDKLDLFTGQLRLLRIHRGLNDVGVVLDGRTQDVLEGVMHMEVERCAESWRAILSVVRQDFQDEPALQQSICERLDAEARGLFQVYTKKKSGSREEAPANIPYRQ